MTDQTPEADQTPESRLTAALWDALEGIGHIDVDASERGDGYGERAMLGLVRSALAADPTLAADLALAAAVKRLYEEWPDRRRSPHLFADGPGWRITTDDWTIDSGIHESLPDAVDAAIIKAAKEASE